MKLVQAPDDPLRPADASLLNAGERQMVRHLAAAVSTPPRPGNIQLPLEIFSDRAKSMFVLSWLHETWPRLDHARVANAALRRDPARPGYLLTFERTDGATLDLSVPSMKEIPPGEAAKLVLFLG